MIILPSVLIDRMNIERLHVPNMFLGSSCHCTWCRTYSGDFLKPDLTNENVNNVQ